MAGTARNLAERRDQLPAANQAEETRRNQIVQESIAEAATKGKQISDQHAQMTAEANAEAVESINDLAFVYETASRKLQTTPAHQLDLKEIRAALGRAAGDYDRARLADESVARLEAEDAKVAADPEAYYENLMARFPLADGRTWDF